MKTAVLTVSDGVVAGTREDKSGDILADLLEADGDEVERRVVPDEAGEIAERSPRSPRRRARLTTGGTGVVPRDVTPEATRSVIDREAPGIAEAIRADSFAKTPQPCSRAGSSACTGDARRQSAGVAGGCPRWFCGPPAALAHALGLLAGADMTHRQT